MNVERFAGSVRDAVALVLQQIAAPPWAVDRVARLPAPLLVRIANAFEAVTTVGARHRRIRVQPAVGADAESRAIATKLVADLERMREARKRA